MSPTDRYRKEVLILQYKQDRFTTCFKTCGTGSLFWRVDRGCKQTDRQDWWWVGAKYLWCQGWTNVTGGASRRQTPVKQISRFDDIKILFIYLNILMMLNKILIQWFWFDDTTKAQKSGMTFLKFSRYFFKSQKLTNKIRIWRMFGVKQFWRE